MEQIYYEGFTKYDRLANYCNNFIKENNIQDKYYLEDKQIPNKYINFDFINKYGILLDVLSNEQYEFAKMLIFSNKINFFIETKCVDGIINYNMVYTLLLYSNPLYSNYKFIKHIYKKTNFMPSFSLFCYLQHCWEQEYYEINICAYLIKIGANIHYTNSLNKNCFDYLFSLDGINDYKTINETIKLFYKNGFNINRLIIPLLNAFKDDCYMYIVIIYILKHYYIKLGPIAQLVPQRAPKRLKQILKFLPFNIINSNKYKVGFIFGLRAYISCAIII